MKIIMVGVSTKIKSYRETLKPLFEGKLLGIQNILVGIHKKSISDPLHKFDNLYNLLGRKDLLIQALGNIHKNKGRLTPGTSKQTIDGISLKKIEKLSQSIKDRTFKFGRIRRIFVVKPKILKLGEPKKLRPLGIPNFNDRIVQEAIRILLEAIYEPVFEKSNNNFGFRTGKSAHNNIQFLKYNGPGMTVAIEGDVKAAYDNVNHDILISILKKKIVDKRFLNLLYKGFKCGLLNLGEREDTLLGVPQGGIASPILFNIYMETFDTFVRTELQSYVEYINEVENRTYKPINKEYYSTQTMLDRVRRSYIKLKGNKKFVEMNEKEKGKILEMQQRLKMLADKRFKLPSLLLHKKEIKLVYSRYADDFIILSNCKKEVAYEIKDKIANFLKNSLDLELSPDKTYITNLKCTPAKFLGFSLKSYTKRRLTLSTKNEKTKRAGWNLILDCDLKRMLEKLQLRGFCNNKFKPIAKSPYTVLRPEEIVNRYNSMIRGIGNYYFPCLDRLSVLNRIIYILKFSCLSTFAKKYKSKITKITKKYGDPLKISISEKVTLKPNKNRKEEEVFLKSKDFVLLNYKTLKEELEYKKFSWTAAAKKNIPPVTTDIFHPMRSINWRTYKNLTNVCCICGTSENVEQHYIKHIKKGNVTGFSQVMKQLNRRMVPLCRTHHVEVQHGKYDNIKLEDLIDIERLLA